MARLLGRRGLSIVEYAILVVCGAGAFLLMFPYIRSAVCHQFKVQADATGHGLLYQP